MRLPQSITSHMTGALHRPCRTDRGLHARRSTTLFAAGFDEGGDPHDRMAARLRTLAKTGIALAEEAQQW